MSETYWPPGDPISDEESRRSDDLDNHASPKDQHFYGTELSRSLVECAYGIHSWEQAPPDESKPMATASVELLDRKNLVYDIGLDIRGYFVQPKQQDEKKPFLRRFGSRSRSEGSTSMPATSNVAGHQPRSSRPFLRKLTTAFPSGGRSTSSDHIQSDGAISSPVSSNGINYTASPILPMQTHHETLENLLSEISPVFREKQLQVIEEKLFHASKQIS